MDVLCQYCVRQLSFLFSFYISGSGLGYFLFNPIQQMYAEKYLNTQPNDVSSEAQRTSGQTINRDGAINQGHYFRSIVT